MEEKILRQEFEWKNRKEEFYKRREAFNQNIEDLKIRYNDKEPSAIEQYCLLIRFEHLQLCHIPTNLLKIHLIVPVLGLKKRLFQNKGQNQ